MKTFTLTIQFRIFPFALLICSLITQTADANLLEKNKSDTAIKMLVFPKSLRVLENRENVENGNSFSDPKRIRKTLLKLDPARIVPAKAGEPFIGPVTRVQLRELAKKYSEDVIFIFRRKVNNAKNSIHHQGLLYLARQKKVLALKESKEVDTGSLEEMDLAGLKFLAKQAKKVLHSHKFEKRQSAY